MAKRKKVKRLYRSRRDRWVAGVCGGIADYYNVDPTIVRLLWAALTILTGIVPGIILYVFAVFLIPTR